MDKGRDVALTELVKSFSEGTSPIVSNHDPEKELFLLADACREGNLDGRTGGLAYVLLQMINGKLCIVDTGSRILQLAEKRYSVTELECLGVVWSTRHTHDYVEGREFTILTDHSALVQVLGKKNLADLPSLRLQKQAEKMLPYDYKIQHEKGSQMTIVDTLS